MFTIRNFAKYHALGNVYLILPHVTMLTALQVRQICHGRFGENSDGLLIYERQADDTFRVRIYNPDGSTAEKSGNGLRILARYLYDSGQVNERPFTIHTAGGPTTAQVHAPDDISVEMGGITFPAAEVRDGHSDSLHETIETNGRPFTVHRVSVGNPHAVIRWDGATAADAQHWGPHLEIHPFFGPARTNVQFLTVLTADRIAIQIWERGAGYTSASGSSSCAAAAVAHRLYGCNRVLTVQMPGGDLHISLTADLSATLRGPVTAISSGRLAAHLLESG